MTIADNIAHIQERIAASARRCGRSAEEITLVAVAKLKPAESIAEAIAAGICDIGENYVQEGAQKRALLGDSSPGRWHLLGHLQRNKAALAAQVFDVVQSIDSIPLAETLGRHAAALGKTLPVLLEVHLGAETTKSGFAPEQVLDAAAQIAALPGLRVEGLMGIAPFAEEPRPYFRQLRALYDSLPRPQRQTLSMGMTADFETAIEEGATLVRIGTAIFGSRASP